MVHMILDTATNVNSVGGMFGSALAVATLEGHTEVERIL